MEYRYSTIRLGNNKRAHVFDHGKGRVLCGVNRFHYTPFKLNKKKLDVKTMAKNFNGYAERRGGLNPYKFTCKRCTDIINKLKGGI